MTAPKLIWAAPWKDCDGEWPEGDWDTHEGRTLDKPCARYIRADAPELVALVEAVKGIVSDAWGYGHLFDSPFHAKVHDELHDKLAAYEALQ